MTGRPQIVRRFAVSAGLLVLLLSPGTPASAAEIAAPAEAQGRGFEVVFFPTAPPRPPSAFKLRIAESKGLTLQATPPTTILGRLGKPDGEGPFAAVVLLHGSTGIWQWNDLWMERLKGWGYVVLDVDSLTPRGFYRHNTSPDGGPGPRVLDALGALDYLKGVSYVDPARIAVLGMSEGGATGLAAIAARYREESGGTFRAAVAYYPPCHAFETYLAPVLILIGSADQWVSTAFCEQIVPQIASRHAKELVVYDDAHHVFDFPGLDQDLPFGIVRYDEQAAKNAIARTRAFLARHLGGAAE